MKKIILKTALGLILLGVLGGVLTVLPNELAFKFYNRQGILAFQQKSFAKSAQNLLQASLKFSPWKLAGKNNELSTLYEQKKYSELTKKLTKFLNNDCSLSAKKLPSFCENIFYLAGLTQYQRGKNLETKKQKPFFEQAIFEFQKTLAINPQNTWAKENIDFILKNFSEKQQKKTSDDGQQGENENEKEDSSAQNKSQQNSSTNDSQEKDESSSPEQDKEEKSGENEQGEEDYTSDSNQESSAKNQPTPSRLPQNIQQALEQAQQDLEQNKNQQGFNRSRSAAKNDQNSQDPFQDDFLQDFFGNDPFFNSFFGRKNKKKFHKNITNPNEKDW